MGHTRKRTPELLDKLIVTIWSYQQEHKTTPPSRLLLNEIGVGRGFSYYRDMLEEQGRLKVLSVKPLHAVVLDHPANTKAIMNHLAEEKRRLAAPPTPEPAPTPEPEPEPEVQTRDYAAEFAADYEDATVTVGQAFGRKVAELQVDAPPLAEGDTYTVSGLNISVEPEPTPEPMTYGDISARTATAAEMLRHVGKTPDRSGLADYKTGELILELIERGYTVSKR